MKNKIPIPPNGSRQQLLVRAINYFRSREGEPACSPDASLSF